MTETKETYNATSVADTVPDAMTPEAAILALAGQVADLERTVEANRVESVNRDLGLGRRVNKLQDAHLAPALEGSAVVVELRRIANFLEIFRPGVAHDSTPTEPCDCAELWRLARAYSNVRDAHPMGGPQIAWAADDFLAYVREHTP